MLKVQIKPEDVSYSVFGQLLLLASLDHSRFESFKSRLFSVCVSGLHQTQNSTNDH